MKKRLLLLTFAVLLAAPALPQLIAAAKNASHPHGDAHSDYLRLVPEKFRIILERNMFGFMPRRGENRGEYATSSASFIPSGLNVDLNPGTILNAPSPYNPNNDIYANPGSEYGSKSMYNLKPFYGGNAGPGSNLTSNGLAVDHAPGQAKGEHAAGLAGGEEITAPSEAAPNYLITGVIKVNGRLKAIVENKATGNGYYVGEGDTAGDYKVAGVAQDDTGKRFTVTLTKGDSKFELYMDRGKLAESAVKYDNSRTTPDTTPEPLPDSKKIPGHAKPRIGH